MKLPRYPKYKDSGVKWLGQVPEHWKVLPCRALVVEQTTKNEGAENDNYLSLMANVGIIPYEEKGDIGNKKPDDLSKCKMVSVGDLVINSMNYRIGSYGLSALNGVCSPVYIVLRPRPGRVEPRFAFRLFENRAFQNFAQSFGNGILDHRAAISWDTLKNLGLSVPTPEEQNSILTFLDGETYKIDDLISEQQHLIELLKEERQAIISHAVTKGLNPDAPMKPSGVKWLGYVPTSWKVCLLKRAFRSVEYGISDAVGSDGSIAILRMGNIVGGKIDYTDLKYIDAVDGSLLLQAGDLLYNRTNSLDQIGKVGLFHGDVEGQFSFASYLVRLRTGPDSLPEFFAYLLNTENILGLARASAFVAIGQCNLNPSRYGRIIVAIPPKTEQLEIVHYLDKATAKIDILISDAFSTIDILQERRSALISAAVTGQIDVRGESSAAQ